MLAFSGSWSPGQEPPVQMTLRARFPASGAAPRLVLEEEAFRSSPLLPCFYERRGYTPAWSNAGALRPAAGELLSALAAAGDHGLRPEDYRPATLQRLASAAPGDALGTADLDLLLSNAFLTCAAHLRRGKVNPEAIYRDCALGRDQTDLAAVLEEALRQGRVRAALAGLAPSHQGYALLRDALARYHRIALRGDSEPVPPGANLRLGDQGERVAVLRARLADAAEADAAEPFPPSESPDLFDASLEEAVRRFQQRHGLEALRDNQRWNADAIRAGIEAGRERSVRLPHKIPVHIAYWTAWVGEDGTLRLGRDVYQRDAELARLLGSGAE